MPDGYGGFSQLLDNEEVRIDMSGSALYFHQHYSDVTFPIQEGEELGLHNAQLGAIHSIASHFTIRSEPAIVAMPTGSGKTAVLMLTAFLLRAKRVLVMTPGKLVRDQIAEEFQGLAVLKKIGAVPFLTDAPIDNH